MSLDLGDNKRTSAHRHLLSRFASDSGRKFLLFDETGSVEIRGEGESERRRRRVECTTFRGDEVFKWTRKCNLGWGEVTTRTACIERPTLHAFP